MLSIYNIEYYTTNKLILSKVSFTLLPSSLLILQGNNGSGKTTLLKILAGLLKPKGGAIYVAEENIKDFMPDYMDNICFISHQNSLKNDLSVIDNIEFWASLKNNELLIPSAIAYFELGDILDEKCGNLSSGMRKKVELTKLITSMSEIWLLDEPEVNLDLKTRDKLFHLINTKVSNGGIVIMASHHDIAREHKNKIIMEDFIHV